jgi:hypothetical protein
MLAISSSFVGLVPHKVWQKLQMFVRDGAIKYQKIFNKAKMKALFKSNILVYSK